ncbi:MAG: CoB--CoM heterodisulfide reductase iron-sulfur subunit B family protein [Firmicutes bacterium]|nr:CoB--CoM heterodisulfide reductase iron-sulfur subunit B family protein [Bacillota bacterium]
MKIAYYPGCSLHAAAREYDASLKLCLQNLGIELTEVPDWNCCGATSAHSIDEKLSILLAARNLSLAKKMVSGKVLAPCAACYSRLLTSRHRLQTEARLYQEIASRLPDLDGVQEMEVLSLLDLLCLRELRDRLKAGIVRPLNGLRVACYYGCFLVRPAAVTGQPDPEDPTLLEAVLAAAGAEPVPWTYKTECCGAGFVLPEPQVVLRLAGEILQAAKRSGADVIAVACPLCQMNLDARQEAVARELGEELHLPVLYVTQLLGLAMGFAPRVLGLKRLLVDPFPALQEKGII